MNAPKRIAVWISLLAMLPVTTWSQVGSGEAAQLISATIEHRGFKYQNIEILVVKVQGQGMNLDIPEAGVCAAAGCQAYKVEPIQAEDGTQQFVLRQLTLNEIGVLTGMTPDSLTMELYGEAMFMAQEALNQSIRGAAMSGLGGPAMGMLVGQLESPQGQAGSARFYNPMKMFQMGGMFAQAAGRSIDDAVMSLLQGPTQAQAEDDRRRNMMRNPTMGPIEERGGRQGQRIDFNDINEVMVSDQGDEFLMSSASIWIDTEHPVMLGHRVEGSAEQGGQSRDFFIESIASDFRFFEELNSIEPFKTTMRMGGVMTPKEQKQMAEAREQLKELDAQMAAMPPDQRKMMENMMGGQLESIRSMATDGVMQHVQVTEAIYVDPDLKALYSAGPMDGVVMPTAVSDGNVVKRIQRDLTVLGYDPGDADGELTTMTVIAISQYQAERDMEVTGEATQELAETITAELRQ
jgi:hypothetical protein